MSSVHSVPCPKCSHLLEDNRKVCPKCGYIRSWRVACILVVCLSVGVVLVPVVLSLAGRTAPTEDSKDEIVPSVERPAETEPPGGHQAPSSPSRKS